MAFNELNSLEHHIIHQLSAMGWIFNLKTK